MAKGNLLLGTAARSIGDVTMYRREGAQVSRIRIRQIKNPKTKAQCAQRAYMSAVVRFYQPLADILERSFEGLSKAKSYSKFLQVNVNMARANHFTIAKDGNIIAYPFQLSEGSLGSLNTSGGHTDFLQLDLVKPSDVAGQPQNIGDLSKFFIAAGFKAGDVVTFILAKNGVTDEGGFHSEQFMIDPESEDTLEDTIHASNGPVDAQNPGRIRLEFTWGVYGDACIVSRFVDGSWKRTTSFLGQRAEIVAYMQAPERYDANVASFSNTAGDVNPLVYLDGDELVASDGD